MEKVYTMQDWQRDGVFNANIGQEVEDAVYYEFLNCVPPAFRERGVMQVGEPYSTDKETRKHLYTTFKKDGDRYYFLGHCLLGQTEHRESWEWDNNN